MLIYKGLAFFSQFDMQKCKLKIKKPMGRDIVLKQRSGIDHYIDFILVLALIEYLLCHLRMSVLPHSKEIVISSIFGNHP